MIVCSARASMASLAILWTSCTCTSTTHIQIACKWTGRESNPLPPEPCNTLQPAGHGGSSRHGACIGVANDADRGHPLPVLTMQLPHLVAALAENCISGHLQNQAQESTAARSLQSILQQQAIGTEGLAAVLREEENRVASMLPPYLIQPSHIYHTSYGHLGR